jgi:predicted DNA-binding protein
MTWILESTLQALSRFERERSLTLEERIILHLRQVSPLHLPTDVLERARHGSSPGKIAPDAVQRLDKREEYKRWEP